MKPKYLKKFKKRISFVKESRYKSPIKKNNKTAKKVNTSGNFAKNKNRITRNGRVSPIFRSKSRSGRTEKRTKRT